MGPTVPSKKVCPTNTTTVRLVWFTTLPSHPLELLSTRLLETDTLNRVKTNAAKKREAKAKGETVFLKRQPAKPREARIVKTVDNVPQTLAPVPYETFI